MPYLPAEQRPGFANGTQPKPPTALDMCTPAADLILTLQRNNTARWFGAQAVRVAEVGSTLDETVGLFCADGRLQSTRVSFAAGRRRRWPCIKHRGGMALPRFARYRPRCLRGETSDTIEDPA